MTSLKVLTVVVVLFISMSAKATAQQEIKEIDSFLNELSKYDSLITQSAKAALAVEKKENNGLIALSESNFENSKVISLNYGQTLLNKSKLETHEKELRDLKEFAKVAHPIISKAMGMLNNLNSHAKAQQKRIEELERLLAKRE